MSRGRFLLAAAALTLSFALIGALLGLLGRHPLGGFICGLLLGWVYVGACALASDKFPGDAWGAALLENSDAPNLYEMLHALADRTGEPLPTLYFIPRPEPNAFVSAGRDGETAIFVTSGLTRRLPKDEVQAVLALMMARLASGAMPSWTAAATLAGVPVSVGLTLRRQGRTAFGNALLSVIALPAAALVKLVWDERVVSAADNHAAHLTESPGALARALVSIEAGLTEDGAWAGNPAAALLFAVAPLLPVLPGAPRWRRGLESFPGRVPGPKIRAEQVAEIVSSYVPETAEEFPNW